MRAASVVEKALEGGQREVASEATFSDGDRVPVFLRFPDAGPIQAAGDAFLPMLLGPAMALHEDLRIDAPVSRSLLEAANERIAPVLAGFRPELARIEVRAAEVVDDSAATHPPGVAAFFSGGLDSSWTFMRHCERLTHLVYLRGFDIQLGDAPVLAVLSGRARALAQASGLEFVEITGNGRRGLARTAQRKIDARCGPGLLFNHDVQLGSLLVSFAQGLAGQVGRVILGSSWPVGETFGAHGSHPWIEPNWSTPRLAIELDGVPETRVQKVRDLAAGRPDLLRALRVCWVRPHRTENCGRCGKCIRLRMELRAAGVPPAPGPFADELGDGTIRRARVSIDADHWQAILEAARARGDAADLKTVEILMGLRRHPVRELERQLRKLRRRARRLRRRVRARLPLPG